MNQKTVRKVLKDNKLNLPASKHRGRTKSKGRTMTRNLLHPHGPDQLCETAITYIPTEWRVTYLMCIKDTFTREWQGYHYLDPAWQGMPYDL